MAVAIRTQGLTKQFKTLRAVDDLNLTVEQGTIFGFLGPNGAGKTTTLQLLLGLIPASSGYAEVLGHSVAQDGERVRSLTGALLEHHGLYERMSAYDNLDFYGRIYQIAPAERAQRIKLLLDDIGLWDRRKEVVGKWSRGMKQKLAIVRTFLHHPPLVILDEPTAGHDPVSAAELRATLQRLVKTEGLTFFITTHNLTEAEQICNRVGVINQGRLLASGSPRDIRAGSGKPRVEIAGRGFTSAIVSKIKRRADVADAVLEDGTLLIDLRGPGSAAPLVRAVVDAGVEVEEVRKGKESLEAAFIALLKGGKN